MNEFRGNGKNIHSSQVFDSNCGWQSIKSALEIFTTTHRTDTIFSDSEEDIERKLFHHCFWPILKALACVQTLAMYSPSESPGFLP